jgi:hypothetical protein
VGRIDQESSNMTTLTLPFLRSVILAAFVAFVSFSAMGCTSKCVDGNCTCVAGETCDFTCAAGGCNQQCDEGSNCTTTCVGGGCAQNCNGDATCDFACEGGGCAQSCGLSASCVSSCAGSGCSTL